MYALVLEMEPSGDTLIRCLEGDPSRAVFHAYIPGSALRGAAVGRYLGRHDVDLATEPEARALFLDGTTAFLNAYPVDACRQRSIPAPLSWVREKDLAAHHGQAIDVIVSSLGSISVVDPRAQRLLHHGRPQPCGSIFQEGEEILALSRAEPQLDAHDPYRGRPRVTGPSHYVSLLERMSVYL